MKKRSMMWAKEKKALRIGEALLAVLMVMCIVTPLKAGAASRYVKSLKVKGFIEVEESKSVTVKPAVKVKNGASKGVTVKSKDSSIAKAKFNKKKNAIIVTGKKAGNTIIIVTTKAKNRKGKKISKNIKVKVFRNDKTTEKVTIETPATEKPTTEKPTTEMTSTEAVTTEKPAAEKVTTEKPTAEKAATETAATEKPTTEKVAEETATTEKPTTETVASTEAVTTEKPTTEKVTTEKPTAEKVTTEKPTAEKVTTEKTTTEKVTTEKVTTEKATTEKPTAEKVTTEATTTERSTAEAGTTERPTTEAGTTEKAVTEAGTTETGTTETGTTETQTTEDDPQNAEYGDGWELSDGILKISKIHYLIQEITGINTVIYLKDWPQEFRELYIDAEMVCDNVDSSLYADQNLAGGWVLFGGYDSLEKITIKRLDPDVIRDLSAMFANNKNLTTVDLEGLNTANVKNMSWMFSDNPKLSSINLDVLDLSSVEDFSYMFYCCTELTAASVTSYDASKVTTFYNMFSGCTSLTSVQLGDIQNAQVAGIFSGCSSLTEPKIGKVKLSHGVVYMFDDSTSISNYLFTADWDLSDEAAQTLICDDCYDSDVLLMPSGTGETAIIVDVYYKKEMPEWYKERSAEVALGVEGWWKTIDQPMYTQYSSLESDANKLMEDYLDQIIEAIDENLKKMVIDSIENEEVKEQTEKLTQKLEFLKKIHSDGFTVDNLEEFVENVQIIKDMYEITEKDIEDLMDIVKEFDKRISEREYTGTESGGGGGTSF